MPPEIIIEILSPSDKPADVETKRKEYLAWGVSLLLIVDYVPPMFPDLHLPLQRMFGELDFPELNIPEE